MAIPTNLPSNVHRTHSRFSTCRNDSSSNNSGEASLLVGQLLGDPAYLRQSIAALGERDGPLQLIQGWRLEPIRQRQAAVNHKGCPCDVARYPVRKHSESNWRQILGPPKTPERNVPGQRRVGDKSTRGDCPRNECIDPNVEAAKRLCQFLHQHRECRLGGAVMREISRRACVK